MHHVTTLCLKSTRSCLLISVYHGNYTKNKVLHYTGFHNWGQRSAQFWFAHTSAPVHVCRTRPVSDTHCQPQYSQLHTEKDSSPDRDSKTHPRLNENRWPDGLKNNQADQAYQQGGREGAKWAENLHGGQRDG
eukprot:Colp12_sorted_trinity150504_noHs@16824